jgi:redox-sensitive bicupin YhaK (pirin superfamily)
MFLLRPASERGLADHGWLKSYHTFSFADYHDPRHMGFRALRVINEDRVQPGRGFGAHSHRDMEIISYVLEGGLRHKDSIGTGSVIRPGDVQRMSAGRGVLHSEFNHAADATTHFLQIWIEPSARGIDPGYEQRHFPDAEKRGRLRTVASPDGRDGSVTIHADASISSGLFDGEERVERPLAPGRKAWVHVVRGSAEVNGRRLEAGDALGLDGEPALTIAQGRGAEVLVFDLQ